MKYSTHDYAKALNEALADPKGKEAAIAKNFLVFVRRNNDGGRLSKILNEAARLSQSQRGFREVTIESARPIEKAQEKIISQLIKTGDIVAYEENPELIAGIRITINDEMQFDGTMKAKLDTLFGASF